MCFVYEQGCKPNHNITDLLFTSLTLATCVDAILSTTTLELITQFNEINSSTWKLQVFLVYWGQRSDVNDH